MTRFPAHPSLVRPSSESSGIHGAVLGIPTISSVEDDKETTELEMRAPAVMKRPVSPTQADLDKHYPLHLNYRSWCPHCVHGKGHASHHKTAKGEKLEGITIHLDYCFFGRKSPLEEEKESEDHFPVLVVYDDDKDTFWAIKVSKKGATREVVKWLCDKLEDSGYTGQRMSTKCDQEPAIIDLRRAVSATRLGETVPLSSPVRCPKANGKMENSVSSSKTSCVC